MKRFSTWSTLVVSLALIAPSIGADVKTTQVDSFKFEGAFGGFMNRFSRGAKDGTTSTVAVHGNRMAKFDDRTGQVIDLDEERVYEIDMRKKRYEVRTFAELREQFEKARAEAEEKMKDMKPEEREEIQSSGPEMEVDVEVQDMNESQEMLGQTAKRVVLTVTARQKGETVEAGGGFVMTTDSWLVPTLPELNEIAQFQLRFAKAVYGENFSADMERMAGLMAMVPSFKTMSERMETEGQKMEGVPVLTATTFETIKSEEQMKAAADTEPSGGGFGGRLARKLMPKRGEPQPRTKAFTASHEVKSVSASVSETDVAIPAGFKEKK